MSGKCQVRVERRRRSFVERCALATVTMVLATGPLLALASSDSGTWTFADRETITFAGIESYDPTNVREMVEAAGLSSGHTTALLAKLNLKGDSSDAGRLNAFIEQVANLVARGELTAAEGTALTQAASLLLLSIPA